jgi:hypothetical protein
MLPEVGLDRFGVRRNATGALDVGLAIGITEGAGIRMTRLITPLFLAVGLLAWSAGLYIYRDTQLLVSRAEHARGVVVALSRSGSTYAPVVNFKTTRGTEIQFVGKVATSSPRFVKGEALDILYLPDEPTNARINSFLDLWGLPLFLAPFGGIFVLVGSVPALLRWKARRAAAVLKVQGRPILADYERVALNPAINVNGESPFRIIAQWQDPATSTVHVFHSDNIWFDPQKYIDRKQLTVYVDPNDPKRYYVDTSFLPTVAR